MYVRRPAASVLFDMLYKDNYLTTVRAWINCWQHFAGRAAHLRLGSVMLPIDMPLVNCIEKLLYTSRLRKIMSGYVSMQDEAFTTYSFN